MCLSFYLLTSVPPISRAVLNFRSRTSSGWPWGGERFSPAYVSLLVGSMQELRGETGIGQDWPSEMSPCVPHLPPSLAPRRGSLPAVVIPFRYMLFMISAAFSEAHATWTPAEDCSLLITNSHSRHQGPWAQRGQEMSQKPPSWNKQTPGPWGLF